MFVPPFAQTVGHHKVARLYSVLQILLLTLLRVDVSNEVRVATLLSLKFAFC